MVAVTLSPFVRLGRDCDNSEEKAYPKLVGSLYFVVRMHAVFFPIRTSDLGLAETLDILRQSSNLLCDEIIACVATCNWLILYDYPFV